jgi:hypothetical protein
MWTYYNLARVTGALWDATVTTSGSRYLVQIYQYFYGGWYAWIHPIPKTEQELILNCKCESFYDALESINTYFVDRKIAIRGSENGI